MSDPFSPDDAPDRADMPEEEGSAQQALEAVNAVFSWYSGQLLQERRSPSPDADRVARLEAARQEVLEDRDRLPAADAAEQDRIAQRYAARLRELRGA